jgi:HSP20 family protein
MRDLLRWDPFSEMQPMFRTEMDTFMPNFDIKENGNQYFFRADVPGVELKDIEVTIDGNRLQVSGKREAEKEEKGDTYYSCERSFGSFSRAFTLPQNCDTKDVHADLTNGVLTIAVAKNGDAQARKIPVQASKTKS